MDFTYCRTWTGWVYIAFIVDVYSQRIVAWHAQTTKHVELVMIPLRMALWERAGKATPSKRTSCEHIRTRGLNTSPWPTPTSSRSTASHPRSGPSATRSTTR